MLFLSANILHLIKRVDSEKGRLLHSQSRCQSHLVSQGEYFFSWCPIMYFCLTTSVFKSKYQGRQSILQWAPFSRLMHLRNIFPYLISLTHFLSCYRASTAVYLAIIFESISENVWINHKRQEHHRVTVLWIKALLCSFCHFHWFHMAALVSWYCKLKTRFQ